MKRKTILWLIGAPILAATPFLAFFLYLSYLMPAHIPPKKVDLFIQNPGSEFAERLVAELATRDSYTCQEDITKYFCYWLSTRIIIPFDGTGIYFRYPQKKQSWLAPRRKLPDPTYPITEIQEILDKDAIAYERKDRTR